MYICKYTCAIKFLDGELLGQRDMCIQAFFYSLCPQYQNVIIHSLCIAQQSRSVLTPASIV